MKSGIIAAESFWETTRAGAPGDRHAVGDVAADDGVRADDDPVTDVMPP